MKAGIKLCAVSFSVVTLRFFVWLRSSSRHMCFSDEATFHSTDTFVICGEMKILVLSLNM